MKYFIIFCYLLFPIKYFGQSKYDYNQGYKFIKKAEKNLILGKLEKAEMFLEKAKLSNFGFCGNAWASAYGEINLIQTKIFNERKEYDKALNQLDSIRGCGVGANCVERDSLKIVTLILKFGKEKVKESFAKVINVEKIEKEYDNFYSAYIKDLNYTFIFYTSDYFWIRKDNKIDNKEKHENDFLSKIKNFNYYKLLE